LKSRFLSDAFVDARADAPGFAKWAIQPRSLGLAHALAGHAHEQFDTPFKTKPDGITK
jgi:hypothetical protein